MNKVLLVGRLTRDPELYTTENGKHLEITLAVNRNFKNKEGNVDADFIQCVLFNSKAENLAKYTKKGDRIGIEGAIRTGSYEIDDGTKRYTTKVYVDNFEFMESRNGDNVENKNVSIESTQSTVENTVDPFEEFGQSIALSDEDLPF